MKVFPSTIFIAIFTFCTILGAMETQLVWNQWDLPVTGHELKRSLGQEVKPCQGGVSKFIQNCLCDSRPYCWKGFVSATLGSPVGCFFNSAAVSSLVKHIPWLPFKLCLLYKANFPTGKHAGNRTLTLLTHLLALTPSRHGERIISTSWRTQCSQVMIHLPGQVTGWTFVTLVLTITAAAVRGSRVLPLSRVWRKNNEAATEHLSSLHVGFMAFSKSAIGNLRPPYTERQYLPRSALRWASERSTQPSLPLLQPLSTPPQLSPSLCFTFSPEWKGARACEPE